jgi:hypothetical protein
MQWRWSDQIFRGSQQIEHKQKRCSFFRGVVVAVKIPIAGSSLDLLALRLICTKILFPEHSHHQAARHQEQPGYYLSQTTALHSTPFASSEASCAF